MALRPELRMTGRSLEPTRRKRLAMMLAEVVREEGYLGLEYQPRKKRPAKRQ